MLPQKLSQEIWFTLYLLLALNPSLSKESDTLQTLLKSLDKSCAENLTQLDIEIAIQTAILVSLVLPKLKTAKEPTITTQRLFELVVGRSNLKANLMKINLYHVFVFQNNSESPYTKFPKFTYVPKEVW